MAYKDEVFRQNPLLYYQLADTAGDYATEVSGDGPVAYWRLEETSGTTAYDETANNHDLTLVNTPTLDVDGISEGSNGMTFTGSSSEYGYVADHADFAWGTAMTAEGWIKTTSSASNQVIVSQWNTDYAFWLGFESAGQATFRVRISSTNYTAQVSGGWADGAWHHVVGVRDGTEIRLYVDGKIVARTTAASGSIDSATSNIDIARVAGSAYTTSSLDEIALYTKVLTSAEILSHYLASSVAVEDAMNTAGGSYNGFPTLNQTGPFTGATAVAFDGTDDYFSASWTHDTSGSWTIAGWLNIDQLNATREPFALANLASNNNRFGLEITSTGTLQPYYYTTGGTKTSATASTLKIAPGAWYYVALVKSGNNLYSYVNGVEYTSTAMSSQQTWNTTTTLNIGSGVAATSSSREEFWDGKLSEVAFFDSALTQNQLAWLYWHIARDLDSYETQVIADGADILWMLDDTSGTTMVDAVGSSDGTYVNTPTFSQADPFAGTEATLFAASSSEYGYYNDSGSFHLSGDGSVECWFKTTSTSTNIAFFNRWVSDYEFFLGINSVAGRVRFFARSGGASYIAEDTAVAYNDGLWHHAVGVRSGGTIYLYIDGDLKHSTACPTGTLDGGTSNLQVAAFGSIYFSDVTLSGVALYQGTALTGVQIQKHYLAKVDKPASPSYYHQLMLSTRPTLYYRLGEASGTVAEDETGTIHGAYINTPTLGASSLVAADTANKAVTFASASSEQVTIANNTVLDTANYSVEAWIQTSTSGSGVYQGIVCRDSVGGSGRHWQFRVANTVLEFIGFYSGTSYTIFTTTHVVTDNKPHHVVATLSGTTMTVYCDGVAQTSTLGGTGNASAASAMTIGAVTSNYYFNGTIDEAAFYNRALTAAEVDEHFIIGSQVRRWDPDDKPSAITLSDRGHKASHTAATWDTVRAERPLNSGKFYWEVTITDTSNGGTGGSASLVVGVATPEQVLANTTPAYTNNVLGWSDNSKESVGWTNYGSQAWADGDIIGVYIDTDAGDIGFTYNGTDKGTMYTGKPTGTAYFPHVTMYGTSAVTLNLGDSAFTYTPPTGYAAPALGPTPAVATTRYMSRIHSDYWVYDGGLSLFKKSGSGTFRGVQGVGSARSTGKWYFEYHSIDADSTGVGIMKAGESLSTAATSVGTGDAYIYWSNNGYKSNGDSTSGSSYGNTWGRHKIGVAVDFDTGKIWWAKDDTWQASGDPAAGTNAAYSTLAGAFLPTVNSGGSAGQYGYFVFDSTDFAYTPPSGFEAWDAPANVALAVADALHALLSGDPLGSTTVELLVADALHALASLNVIFDLPLDLADAIHSFLGGNATFDIPLATAWGTHGHSAAIMVLDQLHNLLVRAATHAHSATASSFFQAHLLATQNTGHALADNVTLDMPLAIDGAGHSSSSNSPAWSQAHVLTGMGGWHRVTGDALVLPPWLIPADASHGHSAENITLLEAVFIQASNAIHAQLAQVGGVIPGLVVANGLHGVDSTGSVQAWLAVASANHAHSAENVVLGQLHQLLVASALHAESAGAAVLSQAHYLTVYDSIIATRSVTHTLGDEALGTADFRVYTIPEEPRTETVSDEQRSMDVLYVSDERTSVAGE